MNKLKYLSILLCLTVIMTGCGNNKSNSNEQTNNSQTNTKVTHKGIVYLDPTNLDKKCSKEDAKKNVNENGTPTEIKTGCMKWYIYDDSGDNYTMILDHNTTAGIQWNDSNVNVTYEQSNIKTVVDDLVVSSGWKVTPRLITAGEIDNIVGPVATWNVADYNTCYHFGSKSEKDYSLQTIEQQGIQQSYHWLFDNLYQSSNYGGSVSDDNQYTHYDSNAGVSENYTDSYWTSTPVGTAGSNSFVWAVHAYGYLYDSFSDISIVGIRPVITIPKSKVNVNY